MPLVPWPVPAVALVVPLPVVVSAAQEPVSPALVWQTVVVRPVSWV